MREHPDREALIDLATQRRWSYFELQSAVDELALGLLARGIAKGDRVGIWAVNCAEWVITQYATAKIGAILVNVNPSYRQHELAFAIKQSGMRMIIAQIEFKASAFRELIKAVRSECPELTEAIFISDPSWEDLIAAGRHVPASVLAERMAQLSPDDPINIQYTSGTTGYPKGATLSHHNILNNGFLSPKPSD